ILDALLSSRLECAQVREHRLALEEFADQCAARGVGPEDFRHTLVWVVDCVSAQAFHVARFVAIVELFTRPSQELARWFKHPVKTAQMHSPDDCDCESHQSNVAGKVCLDTGPLHFYCYFAPV